MQEKYSYDSQNQRTDLSYDENGNINSLKGYTFGWADRRLTSAASTDNSISYTYNYDGIRTGKTVNGVTKYYKVDENNNVVKQYEIESNVDTDGDTNTEADTDTNASSEVNTDTNTETNVIEFVYDSDNTPVCFVYDNETFYYEKNMQGDITGIIDTNGNVVVEYTYDISGELLSITGTFKCTGRTTWKLLCF